MESLDELEHPLLGGSPKHSEGTVDSDSTTGSGLLKGILVRCGEENTLPPLAWKTYCTPAEFPQQQLLDPCSLPRSLESLYPTVPVWGHTESLGLHRKEYLETTFVDIDPSSPLEKKLLEEERDCHSSSYSTDEDDLLPDYEVWQPFSYLWHPVAHSLHLYPEVFCYRT